MVWRDERLHRQHTNLHRLFGNTAGRSFSPHAASSSTKKHVGVRLLLSYGRPRDRETEHFKLKLQTMDDSNIYILNCTSINDGVYRLFPLPSYSTIHHPFWLWSTVPPSHNVRNLERIVFFFVCFYFIFSYSLLCGFVIAFVSYSWRLEVKAERTDETTSKHYLFDNDEIEICVVCLESAFQSRPVIRMWVSNRLDVVPLRWIGQW